MRDLTSHAAALRRLTRTDGDPRVRHRADALLPLAHGRSGEDAAHARGCCTQRSRVWRGRFLAAGRPGLADRPRSGRPARLADRARALLETALAGSPLAYGYPVTTWTVADLADLRTQRGWPVSRVTGARGLPRLGYRYRRPRHDLTRRQDAAAVASAQHVLGELQKRGQLPGRDCGVLTGMHVTCLPTPTWQRPGSGGGTRWG